MLAIGGMVTSVGAVLLLFVSLLLTVLVVMLGDGGGVVSVYVWLMNCGTRDESTPPGVLFVAAV